MSESGFIIIHPIVVEPLHPYPQNYGQKVRRSLKSIGFILCGDFVNIANISV